MRGQRGIISVFTFVFCISIFANPTFASTALFEDDFEDGDLSNNWKLWKEYPEDIQEVITEDGNNIYRAFGESDLKKESRWRDYTLAGKFKLIQGSGGFFVREGWEYRYEVQLSQNNIQIYMPSLTMGGEHIELSRKTLSVSKNTWHDFKVEVYGNTIKFYLDDKLIFDITDEENLAEWGGIGLMTRRGEIYFDDITVTEVPASTDTITDVLSADSEHTNVVFEDDFEDGDYDGWKVDWREYPEDDWYVVEEDGTNVVKGDGNTNLMLETRGWEDYTFSGKLKYQNGMAGMMLRENNVGFYVIEFNPDYIELLSHVHTTGNRIKISQRDMVIEKDKWHDFEAVMKGTNIKFYLDGELLFDADDDTFSGGRSGLVSIPFSEAYFDDIKVLKEAPISADTITDAISDVFFDSYIPTDFLFEDDFEDENLAQWGICGPPNCPGDGGEIITEGDNKVLRIIGHTDYHGGPNSWTDYTYSGRLKIEEGCAGVVARAVDEGWYRFDICPGMRKLSLISGEHEGPHIGLSTKTVDIPQNKWFDYKITVEGNNLKFYLNNELIIDVDDGSNKWPTGHIGMTMQDNSKVFFDDIKVYELPDIPTFDFILSGGPSPTTEIQVDDDLEVRVNGKTVFQDDDGTDTGSIKRNNGPGFKGEPIEFTATLGDTLRIIATDGGVGFSLSPLYLHIGERSFKITDGVPGEPSPKDLPYVFFDETFTIPSPGSSISKIVPRLDIDGLKTMALKLATGELSQDDPEVQKDIMEMQLVTEEEIKALEQEVMGLFSLVDAGKKIGADVSYPEEKINSAILILKEANQTYSECEEAFDKGDMLTAVNLGNDAYVKGTSGKTMLEEARVPLYSAIKGKLDDKRVSAESIVGWGRRVMMPSGYSDEKIVQASSDIQAMEDALSSGDLQGGVEPILRANDMLNQARNRIFSYFGAIFAFLLVGGVMAQRVVPRIRGTPQPEAASAAAATTRSTVPEIDDRIPAIEVVGLNKSTKQAKLLKDVNFRVRQGTLFGIVGTSGGGKSTIIEGIVGRREYTSGDVKVMGYDANSQRDEINKVLGFVPQHPECYMDQTVWDNMKNSAVKWGIKDPDEESKHILEQLEIDERKDVTCKKLSGGQLKRLSLGMELLRGPQILILDEPTTGLDPTGRDRIISTLSKIVYSEKKTVIFTTHHMDEAEHCDEVIIINKGQIQASGTPHDLARRMPGMGKIVEITLEEVKDDFITGIEEIRGVKKVIKEGRVLKIVMDTPDTVDIANKLKELGAFIEGSVISKAGMKEVFIYYTGIDPKELK